MLKAIKRVLKILIRAFKQPLILIKKEIARDIDFKSTEKSYLAKGITFYGAVVKPTDNEIIILETMGIKDIKNTHKIYTLYEDIVLEDLVIMNKKSFYIWLLNNHFDRGMDYQELFISEEAK